MNNIWFQSNKFKLEKIKRFLVEESYKGETAPGGLSPMFINNTLDGAILEIKRLQGEVDTLKAENKKLEAIKQKNKQETK